MHPAHRSPPESKVWCDTFTTVGTDRKGLALNSGYESDSAVAVGTGTGRKASKGRPWTMAAALPGAACHVPATPGNPTVYSSFTAGW